MTYTSFSTASQIVDRFLSVLASHGISPPRGNVIETELLSAVELLDCIKHPQTAASRPSLLAEAGGMADLAAKILAVETQSEFHSFLPHLQLFASKEKWASSVQTTSGSATDDVHRKLNELYLGSLAIHIGFNVALDHPHASRGDNPDVMFDFSFDGQPAKRWALAIKTISSQSGQTIFERIAEASRQINATECVAERGIVVINTQGSLNHSHHWSAHYSSLEDASNTLADEIRTLIKKAHENRDDSEWEDLLSGKTSPIVLYLGHTVTHIATPLSNATPSILKVALCDSPVARQDEEALAIAHGINHYMQVITEGIPGDNGQQPR
ncbi:conserved protein of unknown function [Paraburkholderia kururiensis]|uniref:hypothetical protein n=1 Tax=Paraburkholderia kururiensis TaxID=984307 RepID=UPI0039A4AD5F